MNDKELLRQALDALLLHAAIDETEEEVISALRLRLAQPESEPVAWRIWRSSRWCFAYSPNRHLCSDEQWEPVYTAPPQREWQGLTDEERDEICLGDEAIAAPSKPS